MTSRPHPARDRAAGIIRDMIASGILRPGDPAPTATALAAQAATGYVTAYRAIRDLTDGGILARAGYGRTPRVAGGPAPDPCASTLASWRREAGMTQAQLAAILGVCQKTIELAESGQRPLRPHLWDRADAAVGAGGALAGMYWAAARPLP